MAGPTTAPVGCRFSTGEDLNLLAGPTSAPAGAVVVTPHVDDINQLTTNNPAGTTFYLLAGTHIIDEFNDQDQFSQIKVRSGNTYIGAPGAVLDGRMISRYAFTKAVGDTATGVRIAYLEVINFRAPIEQAIINKDGSYNWTLEYVNIHHNVGAAVGIGTGTILRYCWLHHNSQYGFNAAGPKPDLTVRSGIGIQIHHCEIAHNGDQLDEQMADGGPNPTGGGRNGAGKFWDCGVTDMYSNWIHHSRKVGVWADTDNVDFRFEDNLVEDNHSAGFFYEISYNVLVKNNTFRRNAIQLGIAFNAEVSTFPVGAVYMSEAGSDPRLTQYRYNTVSEITGNTFVNNWDDVVLWENPDRFNNSRANTSDKKYQPIAGAASLAACNNPTSRSITVNLTAGSSQFTVVTGTLHWEDEGQFISGTGIPAGAMIQPPTGDTTGGWQEFGDDVTGRMTVNATITGQTTMTFAAGLINIAPYHMDCRWPTQNVHIHDNTFDHNRSEVLGGRNTLNGTVRTARHALISNTAFPGIPYYGNPYVGDEIQQKITFQNNNVWSNNTYRGSTYNWMPFQIGANKTFAQWQAAPYNQDAGSTYSSTDPITGLANTKWGPPAAPTGVTALAGNGQARVSFNKTADPGGAQVVGYTVTASPGGAQASGRGSPIDVTGLTNGTGYTFTVQTRNAMMLGSASSASNSVTPSAGASYSTAKAPWYPRDVVPQLRNGLVEVSFYEPSDPGTSPVTSYTVTASPGGATTTAARSPATFAAPLPDGVYTFTATAASAVGTSPASEQSEPFTLGTVSGTPPGAPTGVTATAGNGQATVSFTPPASNGGNPITSYTVTSSPGGVTASGASSPIIVTGLTNGTAYTFTVTAATVAGTGAASAPSNSATPTAGGGGGTGLVSVSGTRTAGGVIATAVSAKTDTGTVAATRKAFR